jgi:hypothetical protein
MIPLEVDEVIAMGQHLARARRRGEPFWRTFWKGGSADESQPDDRSPELMELPERPGAVLHASVWGMSVPWTLALSAVLGIWLMAAPALFDVEEPASDVIHLAGALTVVVSVIAMGEPLRLIRWLNVPLGLGVAALPWLLGGATTGGIVSGSVAGLAVTALAVPRGRVAEKFGNWDRLVR